MVCDAVRADEPAYDIDIPAMNAAEALNRLADQTGAIMLFPYDLARTRQAKAVRGRYTLLQGLELLLQGTGLSGGLSQKRVVSISDAGDPNHRGEGAMLKQKQSFGTRVAAFISSIFSVAAASGQSAGQETQTLEEVTVTAQRRGQNVLDVPMSISVLGNERLERAGLSSLEDVAYHTPSLAVLESGSGGATYTMRGVGNMAGSSALVGIYLDETSMARGGLEGQLDMPTFDLNRIEVLKGPQGTLYGEGSVGGTIRLISNDPRFDGIGGLFDVSQSFTRGGDPSQTVRGVLNLPVIDDVLGFRVATVYENTGGWIDIPAESRKNVNDTELVNVRAKALWRPTDKLEIKGTLVVSEFDNDSMPSGTDRHYNIATVYPNQDLSGYRDYRIFNLTATYDFGAFDLLSASSYVKDARSISLNQFLRLTPFPPPLPPVGLLTDLKGDNRTFTQEVRLNSKNDGPFTWDVGAYYRDLDRSFDAMSTLTFDGVVAAATPDRSKMTSRSSALFANVSYGLNERFELGAGLRYFHDDVEIVRPPAVAGAQATVDQDTFDALTPRIYASYHLNPDTMVYLNVAKGFRSGGFNSHGQPSYQPEDLISYDAGIKGKLFNGTLVTELTAFFSKYQKAQAITVVISDESQVFQRIANVGSADIKGVEAAVSWYLTDRFSLDLSGSLIDTEVTSLEGATGTSHLVGDPLDLVPEYTFTVSGTYQVDWFGGRPGFVRADYSQIGRSTTTNRSAGLPTPYGESDVLNLLSARAHAEWSSGWYFELFGENLLNESGNANSWNSVDQNVRPRPKTFGLRLGKSFN